ncbi:MAG: hypothetical protein U9R51_02260 [Actinomycetota bacterium]|nr:hypothetical protein [Actinomycetota bacterium]
MNNIEEHLIAELEREADAVPTLRGNFDRVRRSGRRRLFARRAGTTTAAAFAFALALGPIALLSDGGTRMDASQGGGVPGMSLSGQTTVTTTTIPSTTTPPSEPDATGDVGGVAGSSGVEVDVANAVAPFDHESNVDSHLLPRLIASFGTERRQYLDECMAESGFDGLGPVVLRDRDDPMLISNWQFPPIAMLATEGFAVLPGTPSSPEDFTGNPERTEVSKLCQADAETRFADSGTERASELYGMLRGAWEKILVEVDASDELRPLVTEFSACLVDAGVPSNNASSVERYLGYVDSLIADGADGAAVYEEYGKLYAECGADLFTTREHLRSGERRTEFLDEHAAEISELAELIGASR